MVTLSQWCRGDVCHLLSSRAAHGHLCVRRDVGRLSSEGETRARRTVPSFFPKTRGLASDGFVSRTLPIAASRHTSGPDDSFPSRPSSIRCSANAAFFACFCAHPDMVVRAAAAEAAVATRGTTTAPGCGSDRRAGQRSPARVVPGAPNARAGRRARVREKRPGERPDRSPRPREREREAAVGRHRARAPMRDDARAESTMPRAHHAHARTHRKAAQSGLCGAWGGHARRTQRGGTRRATAKHTWRQEGRANMAVAAKQESARRRLDSHTAELARRADEAREKVVGQRTASDQALRRAPPSASELWYVVCASAISDNNRKLLTTLLYFQSFRG